MHEILGQDRAIEILLRAWRRRRLPHAWVFAGPRGVGKFTTAVAFAKILLDPRAGENLAGEIQADPEGATARMIDAGTHPDLHVIRKELALVSENPQLRGKKLTNIPLDVLREHVIGGHSSDDRTHEAPAYHTAALGHGKVFIIDEAELIDRLGQNTLLKTLEEPPPATYLFLVTAHPERLLPTIRSRCRLVPFGRLDAAAMAGWFDRAGLELDGQDRAWIEGFCEGSPGVAALAAEYGFARWQQRLDPLLAELESGQFPIALGRVLGELVEAFATAWVAGNRNASKGAANKDGARHVLAVLAAHARGRLAAAAAGGEAGPWPEVIELLSAAERQLAGNVNMKLALENLAVQWAAAAAPSPA